LRTGVIDGAAHVVATADPQHEGRFFRYQISRTEAAIRAGAKSRYYPVELSEVLRTIRAVPGRYAARSALSWTAGVCSEQRLALGA
jgi:coenzyme F420-reducing hydrogenase beta subunit